MKFFILTVLSTFIYCTVFAQGNDTWTAFWNKDTLIGFKDKNGVVKIEPKFTGYISARKFENIIAATEEINSNWESYYLTKSGRMIGRDSLHIFDNSLDCESEGFIRFRDHKIDKVGIFNKNGDVVVPAQYNDLTRVRNGMIVALKGAEKRYLGEHYSWVGGKGILIDTNNNVLVDSFKYDTDINFFSLLVSLQPNPDSIRQNFKTINGQYFSFINFENEFQAWLRSVLLNNLTKENLLSASYNEITFWKEPNGWTSESKGSFMDRNFELIKTKLLQLNSEACDYNIFSDGLNPFIYESEEYQRFFNNCREPKDWIHPVKSIVISYNYKKDLIQDHIEFLRTDDGFKLIAVIISKGKIK